MEKFTIGWEKCAAMPKLGLPAIKIKTDKIKTDTGAKTSALHAENVKLIQQDVRSLKSIKK